MIEMLETAAVLHHATSNSLVVLDELGRGTSTHDGYAVAYAVLYELEREIGARSLFSTHYHNLADDFANHPRVRPCMMNFMLQDEELVFLYKLVEGVTPSSFGMNVANLAGVEDLIVRRATHLADCIRNNGDPKLIVLNDWIRRVQ